MNAPEQWETVYQRGDQMIRWPWSDVVGLVTRYAEPVGAEFRVLELGCGSGANVPFFRAIGAQYFAVEGSETAVAKMRTEHPDLRDQIILGDFTRDLPALPTFDLVVDRAALGCNTGEAIKRTLAMVHDKLKLGGLFIGVDWFSTRHGDFTRGEPGGDAYTRTGYQDGVLAGLGTAHFADRERVIDLIGALELVLLEHKLLEREIPADGRRIATWNVVARKCR